MPISVKRWQRYERNKWMRRKKVQRQRIVAEQVFVTLSGAVTAVVREYLLPDGQTLREQYAFWQAGGTTEVVLVEMVDPYPCREWAPW